MGASSTFPQVKGQPYDLYFIYPASDSAGVTNPFDMSSRVVIDGRGKDGPVPVLVDPSGVCRLSLSRNFTLGDSIVVICYCGNPNGLPYSERFHTAASTMDRVASRALRQGRW
jgi:hypothetical protein